MCLTYLVPEPLIVLLPHSAHSDMSQVHVFHLGMTCEGCANAAKRVLGKLGDQVSNVDINMESKEVAVTSTLDKDALLETLKKTGKEASYLRSQ